MSQEDRLKTLDNWVSELVDAKKKLAQSSTTHWDIARKTGLSLGDLESLKSKLEELVKNAVKEDIPSQTAFMKVLTEAGQNAAAGFRCTQEILNIDTSKLSDKQKSILALYTYLSASEGHFSEAVHTITFLLMENHHDLYDAYRSKFVSKYEELDDLNIRVKLQFIEAHGFGFVVESFDRKLRNCIAHQGFLVEDNGDIIDMKTGKKLTDRIETLRKTMLLVGINASVTGIIAKALIPPTDKAIERINDSRRALKT